MLKLSFNPYTYVRTYVMRSLLLKKHDYDKMLKMSFDEIAESLQSTTYRREIDELALKFKGADLIEHALNLNLLRSFEKLKKISDEGTNILIDSYLLRYDYWNIKTIIRSKTVNMSYDEVKGIMLPIGSINPIKLEELAKKEDIAMIFRKCGLFKFEDWGQIIVDFKQGKIGLSELENKLDKDYFERMLKLSSEIPRMGINFKTFIEQEIKIQNMAAILRLRKMRIKDADRFLISIDPNYDRKMKKLLNTKEKDKFLELIRYGEYYGVISKHYDELTFVETQLRKLLLNKAIKLMHKNMLTLDTILAFLFSKEIEIRNLKLITKGKQLHVKEKLIEQELIV